jgi:hypothetical protein
MDTFIEEEPPIYVGIYVDDIIYFSASDAVEKKFESLLSTIRSVDFMGQVSLFLGTEFTWLHHSDGHITVGLTQQSFSETLIDSFGFGNFLQSTFLTPYRSGLLIDSFSLESMSSSERDELQL